MSSRVDSYAGGVGSDSESINFNPISKYEEHVEVEGLTLYDIHRSPRPVTTDKKETMSIDPSLLNAELRCPICLSLMNKTVLVMVCMHRFCAECIERCLRQGNKECPSCRQKVKTADEGGGD